jgi:hypothetical protein
MPCKPHGYWSLGCLLIIPAKAGIQLELKNNCDADPFSSGLGQIAKSSLKMLLMLNVGFLSQSKALAFKATDTEL